MEKRRQYRESTIQYFSRMETSSGPFEPTWIRSIPEEKKNRGLRKAKSAKRFNRTKTFVVLNWKTEE